MWLYRLERKIGWFKIPNLMFYIVIISGLVYAFDLLAAIKGNGVSLSQLLVFDSSKIAAGEIWRVLTFVFVMPYLRRIWLTLIQLYFYYFVGKSLQATWGDFKFTFYYLTGVVGSVIGGFLVGTTNIQYLNMSLFFAFAALFPNLEVLLFFMIPVKVKLLAYFDAILFVFSVIYSLLRSDFADALAAVIAILNFLIFFGPNFLSDSFKKLKFQRTRWTFNSK